MMRSQQGFGEGMAAVAVCGSAADRGDFAPACLRPGGLELTEDLVTLARLPRHARVLDLGCGKGTTVAHLVDRHDLRVIGVDASAAQIARAREARPDLGFFVGRAEGLPFARAAFDAVLVECVLSTLADADAALREIVGVLADDGCLLVSDIYTRGGVDVCPPSGLPSLGRREAVAGLLEGAGFRIAEWRDRSGVLARAFWDAAASPGRRSGEAAAESACTAAAAPSGEAVKRPSRRTGRRLGYFICVARVCARSEAPAAKGAQHGRS